MAEEDKALEEEEDEALLLEQGPHRLPVEGEALEVLGLGEFRFRRTPRPVLDEDEEEEGEEYAEAAGYEEYLAPAQRCTEDEG